VQLDTLLGQSQVCPGVQKSTRRPAFGGGGAADALRTGLLLGQIVPFQVALYFAHSWRQIGSD
jgi:hypothetical protein